MAPAKPTAKARRRRKAMLPQVDMFEGKKLPIPRRIITFVDEAGAYRSGLFVNKTFDGGKFYVKITDGIAEVPADRVKRDFISGKNST